MAMARWSPASTTPAPRGYDNWAYCDPQVTDIITLLEVDQLEQENPLSRLL